MKALYDVEYDYMKSVARIDPKRGEIHSTWFLRTEVNRRLIEHIEKLSQENPNIFEDIIEDIGGKIRSLTEFSKRVYYGENLKSRKNTELLDILNEYFLNFKSLCPYFPIIPESYHLVENRVKKNLERYSMDEERLNRILLYFASSDKRSKMFEFSQRVLQIASNIYSFYGSKRLNHIKTPTELKKLLLAEDSKDYGLIRKTLTDYGWLNYQFFYGEPYAIEDILKKLLNTIHKDPNKKIRAIKSSSEMFHETQNDVNTILKKDRELSRLTKVLRDLSHARQEKYESLSYSGFLVRPLFGEISNRLKVSYRDLMFLEMEELERNLQDNLEAKINNVYRTGYMMTMEKGEVKTSSPPPVDSEVSGIDKSQELIRGTPSSTGISKGNASVVISREDLDKVKDGDILVTIAVLPSYVVVYDKISGIVTDVGGITSHSATIARELGIPCVSDTRIGTNLIEDGELILVNGGKGQVRRIEEIQKWKARDPCRNTREE